MRFPGRDQLTYANVMSTIAVFFALGGVSVGAVVGADEPDAPPDQEQSADGSEESGDGGADGDEGDPGSGGEDDEEDGQDGDGDGGDDGGGDGDDTDGDGDEGDGGDEDQGNDDGGDDQGTGNSDDGDGDEQPAGDEDTAVDVTGTLVTREGEPVSTADVTDEAVAEASCQDGERVVGGGVRTTRDSRAAQPVVMTSAPKGNSWTVTVQNSSGLGEVSVNAYVVCATSREEQE